MKRLLPAACLSCLVCIPALAAAPVEVRKNTIFADPAFGFIVVGGEVDLAGSGWEVDSSRKVPGLAQVEVAPAVPATQYNRYRDVVLDGSRRLATWRRDLKNTYGEVQLRNIAHLLTEYARAHAGSLPGTWEELSAKHHDEIASWQRSPWDEDRGEEWAGPYWLLVPGATWMENLPPVRAATGTVAPPPTTESVPVVLELRPWIDDGRHWVLLSNGRTERRPIDRDLLAKHGVQVKPVNTDAGLAAATGAAPVLHTLSALVTGDLRQAVTLTLRRGATGETVDVRWDIPAAVPGIRKVLGDWARARAASWAPYGAAPGSILSAWTRIYGPYGLHTEKVELPRPNPNRTTDWVSFLGGRAAIQETLQTQVLREAATKEAATVAVADIPSVEVKAHPFEQMLAGQPGGRLALAEAVPPDRFFAWFARANALFPFLDQGADFLFRAGSLFSGNCIDDNLAGRYLARLGLSDKISRKLLDSGQVLEVALTMPDLILLDGTDLTVLLRVKKPEKAVKRLASLGIVELKGEEVVTRALADGRQVHWARRGDLVVAATHREELDAVLALMAAGGEGSLGKTAEFRYMLTRLPPGKNTRMLAYLSDPFIRRMTGPAMKIGQMRRAAARGTMEALLAGSLLARLDGKGDLTTERLVSLGYAPRLDTAEYSLGPDLVPISRTWGALPAMRTLAENPASLATPSEAESYKRYKEFYGRYWRQYFDPVALRLDDAPDGELALEVFILPLLESQLYGELRQSLGGNASSAPLTVPVSGDPAVLTLSVNLGEDSLVKMAGNWGNTLGRITGIDPAVLDTLGPGLHLAIRDGDPIVAQGNGDILGALGRVGAPGEWRRGGLLIPTLLSVLTRPCSIYVQLQDPGLVLAALRSAQTRESETGEIGTSIQRVESRDAWILTVNAAGFARIRLGLEVREGFLVVSNLPWSAPDPVASVEQSDLDMVRLKIRPGAVRKELAALWETYGEDQSAASRRGMGMIYPLLLTVSPDVDSAIAMHRKIFGSAPVHPGKGKWVWKEGQLASSIYGPATGGHLPRWKKERGDDFGLFAGIEEMSVDLRFEEEGLRTLMRWRLSDDD